MNKPYMLLADPELERLRREGVRINKASVYMRLENGGILEIMRPLSHPVALHGDDQASDSARRRYVFGNVSRPCDLSTLRRLELCDRLEGLEIVRREGEIIWFHNASGIRHGSLETSRLTYDDSENLREIIAYMGVEFLERLERRYAENPRDCFI